jgi:hypothetical protein
MLGIRDVLVRIQILGSVPPLTNVSDFFSDFSDIKDANKKKFKILFSCNLPEGTLSSVLKI